MPFQRNSEYSTVRKSGRSTNTAYTNNAGATNSHPTQPAARTPSFRTATRAADTGGARGRSPASSTASSAGPLTSSAPELALVVRLHGLQQRSRLLLPGDELLQLRRPALGVDRAR